MIAHAPRQNYAALCPPVSSNRCFLIVKIAISFSISHPKPESANVRSMLVELKATASGRGFMIN